MQKRSILISGASVAGPALAFWLHRHGGFDVTVVERGGPATGGGYKVDLRGPAIDVLGRMGLTAPARERSAELRGVTVVDPRGKILATMDRSFAVMDEGDLQILRGDLAEVLHGATKDDTEYVFHDAVASISETGDGVLVTFEHGEPREFDIVIGADGVHSNVRSLVFGGDYELLRDLGYHVAGFTAPNFLDLDRWGYLLATPGQLAHVYSACGRADAQVAFMFDLGSDARQCYGKQDLAQQKALVAERFADTAWEMPRVLDAMHAADDFFFDAARCVDVDGWSRGRVALLGDAAWGPSFASGFGTSQAIVGAYILAGELAAARHDVAFGRYEKAMSSWVGLNQDLGLELVRHILGASRAHHWFHLQLMKTLPWLPFARPFARRLHRAKWAEPALTLADYGV